MTKLRRSMTICCLFLVVLLLAGTSRAQTRPPIVEQLAKKPVEVALERLGVEQLAEKPVEVALELRQLRVGVTLADHQQVDFLGRRPVLEYREQFS